MRATVRALPGKRFCLDRHNPSLPLTAQSFQRSAREYHRLYNQDFSPINHTQPAFCINTHEEQGVQGMKRFIGSSILVVSLLGTALAGVLKFTFTISNPDGSSTTVRASSRTNRQGNVTVCDYYSESGSYLGQIQGTTSGTEESVEAFCRTGAPSR